MLKCFPPFFEWKKSRPWKMSCYSPERKLQLFELTSVKKACLQYEESTICQLSCFKSHAYAYFTSSVYWISTALSRNVFLATDTSNNLVHPSSKKWPSIPVFSGLKFSYTFFISVFWVPYFVSQIFKKYFLFFPARFISMIRQRILV